MRTADAVLTTRFGALDVGPQDIVTFPAGLIGLPGHDYVIVPASGAFSWLQSLSDGALALPLTDPLRFFADFALELGDEDRGALGPDPHVYVTVRATPDPADCTANLKAPIVICGSEARQVVNLWPAAAMRVPLFGSSSAAD